MKIVYVRTQFWFNLKSGGSVGHTWGILNGFKQNNCHIKVVSNEKFLGIDNFDYSIIEPKIKRPIFLGELFYNFYAKKEFIKEILRFKPDFIYHRYTTYTFFVIQIAKKLNTPLILEFNSFETWKIKYWGKDKNPFRKFIKKYLLYFIIKIIENYNLKNAFLVVTVSQPLKDDLLKLGIPEEKILVSPNGVDPVKFNPEISKSEKCKNIKQNLGINSNQTVVGFSGTFGPWHGVPQLTKAIERILKDRLLSDVTFLLVGEGPLKSDMKKRLSQYKEVTFFGEVPYSEIQYYLAICDIFVSPHCPQSDGREFFGSPTKLFEYMAMAKGIVASNLGQISKVLENNKTAILVEPGNEEHLTEEILKLVLSPELRKLLGKNARKEVEEKYTWDKNIEKLLIAIRNKIINYQK